MEGDGVYLTSLRKLTEQSATTVRFFEREENEKYMVFGKDAELAAKEVFQTNAVVKTFGKESNKLDCVYLSRSNFESWVRDLLLVKQYRVEVYVNQLSGRGNIEWAAQYKGSPGNLTQFEDILFANNEITVNNGVLGVKVGFVDKNKVVGAAYVNMNECQIHLVEFLDDDALTNLESVVVQLAPKEAVISVGSGSTNELNAVRKILERNCVLVNERKASDFEITDLNQDLSKLLKLRKGEQQNVEAYKEIEKKIACSALCGTIKYLELLNGDAYLHLFSLVPFDYGLYGRLDAAACQALHLNTSEQRRNETTLFSVIDKCRTSQGKRLLAQFMKQPLLDINKLEERLDIVGVLIEDILLRQSLYDDHLRRIPDCQMIARRLLRKRATLQDCYRGYLCISKLPNLLKDLKAHDGEKKHVLNSYFIQPLESLNEDFQKYSEMIESTLDLVIADKGEFVVKPEIHEDFQELRAAMDEIEEKMADVTYSVARELGLEANKSLKLESNTQLGHFFRITLKEEKSIRNNNRYTIMHSTKGGVSFQNCALGDLSDRYKIKRQKYEVDQKSFVQEILEVTAGYAPVFEQLGNLVSILDVLTNFSIISTNSASPFVRPILHPKGTGVIKLEGLRHPCVEVQPNVSFIPNSIEFNKDKKFYIVTGPNMGGKSTFLRSVGVATLLAQVGCYVPADFAEISIVDGILARVGAADDLSKGVSTFMLEMIETSYILKTATPDTLVLIDELGRGTSTYDGFGLCWAISEHLAKKTQSFCILATHFHELTSLADETKSVVNMHFSAIADKDGLTMLYKLENGPCDRSFGIHVTQVTNFPPEVIKTAKRMAKKLEDFAQDEDKDDDEEAVKRRQNEKKLGTEEVAKFQKCLKEAFDKFTLEKEKGKMSEVDADRGFQDAADQLLQDITEKSKQNSYLKHLLQQSEMI